MLILGILFAGRCLLTEMIYFRALRPLLISSVLLTFSGYLFLSKKSFYVSTASLIIAISSALFVKCLAGETLTVGMYNELVCFAVGIVNAILIIFSFMGNSCFSKVLKSILLILILLPVIFLWGYYFSSGAWVSVDTVMALLQTNIIESKEYISDFMTFSSWVALFALSSVFIVCGYLSTKLKKKNVLKYGSIFLGLLVILNCFFAYRHRKNIITDIAIQTKIYTEKYNEFEKRKLARKDTLQNKFSTVTRGDNGVYVLVIGESQNRNNMSAYGYERKTTPWLENMEEDKNFILFQNVYSCHTHTVPVLTYALTAKNQYNDLDLGQSVSLLEVAEAAGFETVWISNQVKYSAWDTPITVIADEANQQFWHNNNVGEQTSTNHYDLKLVESIGKMKLSDKMLIIVHLMGNHGSYRERYPKEFRKFGSEKALDEYDNSILYNDYVMKELFETVKALPNFKGLVYFADHADAVLQNQAHDASNFVPQMTHVPMYMYFSNSYQKDNAKKFVTLDKMKGSAFTNDLIFNTMLGVMDVRVDGVYEDKNDILSDNYDDNVQRFRTLYGKKKIVSEEM